MPLLTTLPEAEAVGLFTLFGLALRRSGSSAATDGAALACYRKLRKLLAAQLTQSLSYVTMPVLVRQLLFLDLFLRTHMPRCYVSLLIDASQQVQRRPSRRNVEVADELLFEAVEHLFAGVVAATDYTPWVADPAFAGSDGRAVLASLTNRVRSNDLFKQCLASELALSGLMDAWAGCYLHLLASGEWSRVRATEALMRLHGAVSKNPLALVVPTPLPPGPMSLLLTVHVVRLVSLYDGGTMYGLPEVISEVPVWGARGGAPLRSNSSSTGGGHVMSTGLLRVALQYWAEAAAAERIMTATVAAAGNVANRATTATIATVLPPFHPAATLDVCVRILNAVADDGRSGGSGRLVPERAGRGQVACLALPLAVQALIRTVGGGVRPVGQRPTDVPQLRAFWDAYMRVLGSALNALPGPMEAAAGATAAQRRDGAAAAWVAFSGDWSDFIVVDVPVDSESAGDNPAGLGPHAAAFLDAGALPTIERLVRRSVLSAGPLLSDQKAWREILMHGPMGHIAALIASVSKRVAAEVAAAGRSSATSCVHNSDAAVWARGAGGILEAIVMGANFMSKLVRGQLPAEVAAAAATPEAAASGDGSRQWLTLAAFATMRLLPPLVRALRKYTAAAAVAADAGSSPSASPAPCLTCQMALVASVAVMLKSAVIPMQASAWRQPAAEVPPPPPLSSAGAQWRLLLLRDADLIGLLNSAAVVLLGFGDPRSAAGVSCGAGFARTLRWTCAVFPQELAAAMQPTAPRAAAVAGPRISMDVLKAILGPGRPYHDEEALTEVTQLMQGEVAPFVMDPVLAAAEAALPPPDELTRCMAPHCCANTGCTNLEGPSEASLPRLRCGGGCGGRVWWYCGRDCQAAHWRAGHKVECRAGGAAAADAASKAVTAAAGDSGDD